MRLLCIDPGTTHSGAVQIDTNDMIPVWIEPEIENNKLLDYIKWNRKDEHLAIEMIASYGMAVGKTTFETVLWIGRFMEAFGFNNCTKIYRKDVKISLCGSMKAKDTNIRVALFDRYEGTGGGKDPKKGTKANPGPLYGLSKHAISALAVGHTFVDLDNQSNIRFGG